GFFYFFFLCAVLISIGISGAAEFAFRTPDDPRIVIDETVGFWTAMAFLPRHASILLSAFVLFRFFDVMKVPGFRFLEKYPYGVGVVLDDVAAGLAANLVLRLLLAVGHWSLVL
ncbi:MAG: phosphatidylglycerophosphatase A, partial [Elusimicrobia bacterium]|nr:phosphatidylglycerophosphatase A [Elusimicrobiota bacterium]